MNPDDYKLSSDALESIFRDQIVPALMSRRPEPAAAPELVLLAGQPGSGKSSMKKPIEDEFRARGGVISVTGDDFRPFHPAFERLLAADDLDMSRATRQAAKSWTDQAIAWARANRFNVIWEDTLWVPERTLAALQAFADRGYHVRIVVLAVPLVRSRIGLLARYIGQRERVGAGRWTTGAAHDSAPYSRVAETMRVLERAPTVERIVVMTRERVVYDERRHAEGRWPGGSPTDALIAAREQPLAPRDRADLQEYLANVVDCLRRTGREHHAEIDALMSAIASDLDASRTAEVVTPRRQSDLSGPQGPTLGL